MFFVRLHHRDVTLRRHAVSLPTLFAARLQQRFHLPMAEPLPRRDAVLPAFLILRV